QLSPEYYQLYAKHHGFKLLDDTNIDLANLIVRTEPGLRYDSLNNPIYDNQAESENLRQLQYEKQKRLLINLLYLYAVKGTQNCLNYLFKLLGAPDGLVWLREYAFDIDQKDQF